MGQDGVVYAVSSKVHFDNEWTPYAGGGLHAYRLSDGEPLWTRDVSHPVLTWPVAAKLPGDSDYTAFVFSGPGTGIPLKAFLLLGYMLALCLTLLWFCISRAWSACCGRGLCKG